MSSMQRRQLTGYTFSADDSFHLISQHRGTICPSTHNHLKQLCHELTVNSPTEDSTKTKGRNKNQKVCLLRGYLLSIINYPSSYDGGLPEVHDGSNCLTRPSGFHRPSRMSVWYSSKRKVTVQCISKKRQKTPGKRGRHFAQC